MSGEPEGARRKEGLNAGRKRETMREGEERRKEELKIKKRRDRALMNKQRREERQAESEL